jgi:hypothetical protein
MGGGITTKASASWIPASSRVALSAAQDRGIPEGRDTGRGYHTDTRRGGCRQVPIGGLYRGISLKTLTREAVIHRSPFGASFAGSNRGPATTCRRTVDRSISDSRFEFRTRVWPRSRFCHQDRRFRRTTLREKPTRLKRGGGGPQDGRWFKSRTRNPKYYTAPETCWVDLR